MMPYTLPLRTPQIPERKSDLNENIAVEFLNDKLLISRWILNDISDEIQGRIEFNDSLIDRIDDSMCELVTRLYQLEPRHDTMKENEILVQLKTLETEKRNRETEMWRDIAALKQELRLAYKEFKGIVSRTKIIYGETK